MASIAQRIVPPADSAIVSTASDRDEFYWCNRLRVSRAMLEEIVSTVGTQVSAIERHLRSWDG